MQAANFSFDTISPLCNTYNCSWLTDSVNVEFYNNSRVFYEVVELQPRDVIVIYVNFSSLTTYVLVLVTCVFGTGIIYLVVNIIIRRKKNEKIVSNNFGFTLTTLLGALIILCTIIPLIGYPSNIGCHFQILLIIIGFNLLYLPQLFKAIRLLILFTSPDLNERIAITDLRLSVYIGIVLLIDLLYLLVWFLVSPMAAEVLVQVDTEELYQTVVRCNSSYNYIFLLVLSIYKTIFCLAGWIISDKTAEINLQRSTEETSKRIKDINDAPQVKLSLTLTFITLIIITMVLLVLNTGPLNLFLCIMIAIYIIVAIAVGSIIYRLFIRKQAFSRSSKTVTSAKTSSVSKNRTKNFNSHNDK